MSDLPAGRELDALVAEKVMGLEIVHHEWPCGYLPDAQSKEAAHPNWDAAFNIKVPLELRDPADATDDAWYGERRAVFAHRRIDGSFAYVVPVPEYSTDLAAAWEVMARFLHDWQIDIHGCAEGWEVALLSQEGDEVFGESDTAPLAICRAALKAVGG